MTVWEVISFGRTICTVYANTDRIRKSLKEFYDDPDIMKWINCLSDEDCERLAEQVGELVGSLIANKKEIREGIQNLKNLIRKYSAQGKRIFGNEIGAIGDDISDFTKRLTKLQTTFDDLVKKHLLPKYRQLDPSLKAGYTGSFKEGLVGNRNKPNYGKPVNLDNFDVDYWIESDILYEKFGKNLKADVEFRKLLSETPGFEGLRPNKKGFSIKFKPSSK